MSPTFSFLPSAWARLKPTSIASSPAVAPPSAWRRVGSARGREVSVSVICVSPCWLWGLVVAATAAASHVDIDGEQEHQADRDRLVGGGKVHQAHAVGEALHQYRTDHSARHGAAAAHEARAADDGRGNHVELEALPGG